MFRRSNRRGNPCEPKSAFYIHFPHIGRDLPTSHPPRIRPQCLHKAQHLSCGIVHRPPLTGASSRRRFLSAQPSSSRLPLWKRCADRSDRVTATLHARTMAENSEVKSPSVPRRSIRSNFLFCGILIRLSCPVRSPVHIARTPLVCAGMGNQTRIILL